MQFIYDDAVGKLVLRLTVGVLMLFHGVSKLFGGSLGFIQTRLAESGLPELLAYGVYVGEIVAPLLIVVGVFSRIGGLLVAINMLFALFLVHMDELFALGDSGAWAIELQMFYLLGGVAIVFLGSGRMAVRPD